MPLIEFCTKDIITVNKVAIPTTAFESRNTSLLFFKTALLSTNLGGIPDLNNCRYIESC